MTSGSAADENESIRSRALFAFVVGADLRLRSVVGSAPVEWGFDGEAWSGEILSAVIPSPYFATIEPVVREALNGKASRVEFQSLGTRFPISLEAQPLLPSEVGSEALDTVLVALGSSYVLPVWDAGVAVEERYRANAEPSPIAVAEAALDGTYLWVNQAMCQLMGRGREELIGMSVIDLTVPKHRDECEAALGKLMRGEITSYRADKQYRHGEGHEIWATTNAVTITDSQGRPDHYLIHYIDIDARVRDNHALTTAEDRARRLADLSPDGVVVAALDGRMLYANIIYAGLAGLAPVREDGVRVLAGAGPDATGVTAQRWAQIRAGQTVRNSLESFDHPDGRRVSVEISSAPIEYDGQQAVLSVVRDVTDRMAKEATLTELRSRQRLSFERAPIGQALVGLDGAFLVVNPALCRLLGVEADDLEGRTFQDFTHPDDLDADLALFNKAMDGDIPGYSMEKRYRRVDGRLVHANLHVTIVRDDDEQPLYFISQIEDLTDRHQREVELQQLSDELAWANEALTETMTAALADQARYRALVDHMPETTAYLYDREHRITVASGDGPTRRGFPEGNLVGKAPDEILQPDDAIKIHELIDNAFAGKRISIEVTLETTGHHLLMDVVPVEPPTSGLPIEVLLVARDLSDRKAKEEALASAHARFAALIEHSSDMVTVTDPEGLILYASPPCIAVLGQTVEETVGSNIADYIHPDDLFHTNQHRSVLLATEGKVVNFTSRVRHSDRGWRHVEITAANRIADPAVQGIVTNARDVTERVEAAEWLEHQAMHDPLTDLPNRALFLDRLEQAIARIEHQYRSCAVLFIDLDRFKGINDSLGHAIGDQVLIAVADRLQGALRPFDSVARLGGDEFVVLADGLDDPSQATVIAERLRRAVSEPILAGGQTVTVGCSVGIALSGEGHRPETLLQEADIALYRAKEQGRNRSEIYDQAMQIRARRRLETEQTIRWALDSNGVGVVYQPIIDLRSGVVIGTEALARIHLPSGDLLGAMDFIPVAEDTGLIVPLGEVVLRAACAQQAAWTAAGTAPGRLSVNVSARQLLSPELVTTVASLLEENDLMPSQLCLELTESALIDAGTATRRHIDALKDLGISLALDDFGTGWSSLAYLRRFPIDTLKIDRSFIAGLGTNDGDTEVVKAIIGLGHSLNMTTVAEGVEEARHEALLVSLGCDHAQGYRYAKPLAPEQMADLSRAFSLEG